MTDDEVGLESKVTFYPLRLSTESDRIHKYTIVRWNTDETISATEETLQIIRLLAQGESIAQTAHVLCLEPDSVLSTVKFFKEIGFIKTIDQHLEPDTFEHIHPWFIRIKRKWFTWLLAKQLLILSFLFIIVGLYLGMTTPHLLPNYRDYFWHQDIFILFTVNFCIGFAILFTHEFAHLFTTKAVGGEARIRFENRFIFPIVETTQYHLAVVPKTLRYFVYLSGMYLEAFLASFCFWILWISQIYSIDLGVLNSLFKMVILTTLYGILWQFSAYLETDVYNFLEDYLNQDNLYIDTKRLIYLRFLKIQEKYPLWNFLFKPVIAIFKKFMFNKDVTEKANDLRTFIHRKLRHLKIYSVFFLIGIAISLLIFMSISLPKDIEYLLRSIAELRIGFHQGSLFQIFKSVIVFIVVIQSYLILLYSMIRKWRRHESVF